MKYRSKLKNSQIEIFWMNGGIERIQTDGFAWDGNTLVLSIAGNKVIIPSVAIKLFRMTPAT